MSVVLKVKSGHYKQSCVCRRC